jgi:hypothetical protein
MASRSSDPGSDPMALSSRAMSWLVVRRGWRQSSWGCCSGSAGQWWEPLLRGLFGVGSTDPVTYVGVAVFLAALL